MNHIKDKNLLEFDGEVLGRVFEDIDTAIIVATIERNIVSMNRAARGLFGYANEQAFGQSTMMLYADSHEFEKMGKQRFNTHASYVDESNIVHYISRSGRVFRGQTSGGAVKDVNGRNLFFVVMIKDDSARIAAEETLSHLHAITSSRQLTFSQRVDAILKLGTTYFGLPIGILSKITGNQYLVQQAIHPENALESGMVFELGMTYCSHVYQANDVQGFHHVSTSEIAIHPCFTHFALEAYIGAPIFVDGARFGTLNFSSLSPTRPFIRQDIEILRLLAGWVGHEIARENDLKSLEHAHQQLKILANTDTLTGLANRHCIERTLQVLVNSALRDEKDLVVAILDFDHFKEINDTLGHSVGDQALTSFGCIVKSLSRKEDFYGRWGGDEFLAIFSQTNLSGAIITLERVKDQLRQSQFPNLSESIKLTLSVGVTALQPEDNVDLILNRIDKFLYCAKRNGRDQIQHD